MDTTHRETLNRRRDLRKQLIALQPDVDAALDAELRAGTPYAEIAREADLTEEALRQRARRLGLPDRRLNSAQGSARG